MSRRTSPRPGLALALLALAHCSGSQPARPAPAASPPATPANNVAAPVAQPAAPAETPDAPFRAHAPDPMPTRAFVAPQVQRFELPNHLTVLLVERHELPIVVASLVVRHGAEGVSPPHAGLATLTASMLEQGTTHHSALELSDAFAALGSEHASAADWDSLSLTTRSLAANFDATLGLLGEMAQEPAFAAPELERQRARRIAAIQQEADNPAAVAGNLVRRALYPERHPFSRSLTGTQRSVAAITRDDLVRFHRDHFAPAEAALVVVGDVNRAALEALVTRTFGHWTAQSHAAPAPATVVTPVAAAGRLVLMDRPHAAQSQVQLASVGLPRSGPDWLPVAVMNTILGGMFSSRVNMNLREAHAYTYGARSAFAPRHVAGPFTVGGAIVTAHTADAVGELFTELRRMRDGDVTADELSTARARLADALPARFETTLETANAVAELYVYGLPLDEYGSFAQRINAVTAADVRRVAQRYLDPAHARVIIVGDRSTVEPTLSSLSLGAPAVRDPWGDAVRPAAHPPAVPPAAGGAPPAAHP